MLQNNINLIRYYYNKQKICAIESVGSRRAISIKRFRKMSTYNFFLKVQSHQILHFILESIDLKQYFLQYR
jgi:hypothetical protein